MRFAIEPAQTMWGSENEGEILRARLRVPKHSTVLAMEANNLLVQRRVMMAPEFDVLPKGDDGRVWLELVAIPIGVDVELPDDAMPTVYLGVMRLAERLTSYAVFAQDPKTSIVFNLHQTFAMQDSERVAKIFQTELLKLADRRLAETIPPGDA